MNLINKIKSISAIIKVWLFNIPVPLAVRWNLTNKCQLKCVYCNLYKKNEPELTLDKIFNIIDQLKDLGTLRISYSGGEPLVIPYINDIFDYTKKSGITIGMNTNGILIPQKIDAIKKVDLLKISLDGPENVHDKIRGINGLYTKVIKGIETAVTNDIRTVITTTIIKDNIDFLDHILMLAEKYDCMAAFQPVKELYRNIDNINDIIPDIEKYKTKIDELIEYKKRFPFRLRNTVNHLKFIRNFFDYRQKLKCYAGKIFFMIMPDGTFLPCDRIRYNYELPKHNIPVKDSLNLFKDVSCKGCGFLGAYEINSLQNFDFSIIPTIKKIFG